MGSARIGLSVYNITAAELVELGEQGEVRVAVGCDLLHRLLDQFERVRVSARRSVLGFIDSEPFFDAAESLWAERCSVAKGCACR